MKNHEIEQTIAEFEQALSLFATNHYVLRLYLTGATTRSMEAVETVKRMCEKHLKDRYELEVVDLHQQPERAQAAHIIAAPTLVREKPLPLRRFIGDLSDPDRILIALDIAESGE